MNFKAEHMVANKITAPDAAMTLPFGAPPLR
jgi:hypothetical protein